MKFFDWLKGVFSGEDFVDRRKREYRLWLADKDNAWLMQRAKTLTEPKRLPRTEEESALHARWRREYGYNATDEEVRCALRIRRSL